MSRQPPPRDPAAEYKKSEKAGEDWYSELLDELREREQSYMES
jgi:hypothetical protein